MEGTYEDFKKMAQELYGTRFAGLCDELPNYEAFCEWYQKYCGEPTFEKYLIAQWVWHYRK